MKGYRFADLFSQASLFIFTKGDNKFWPSLCSTLYIWF